LHFLDWIGETLTANGDRPCWTNNAYKHGYLTQEWRLDVACQKGLATDL
jgi:hypothetical protein